MPLAACRNAELGVMDETISRILIVGYGSAVKNEE